MAQKAARAAFALVSAFARRRESAIDSVRRIFYSDDEHTFVSDPLEASVLTDRQQEIWDFLVDYVERQGYPPTVREIGEHVGLASPSTVHAHLANLERAGYLKRDPTKPRALELVGRERAPAAEAVADAGRVQVLPLVGQIAAGAPLLAEE